MLKDIDRNNRLFMAGNFLFALSYGLWMNLRQLHLGDLGASPAEVGTTLGMIAIAGGVLPLPAGLLTDRIGPKRVILGAWGIAILGTIIAALATGWSMAGVGFAVFMLVIAANPATVTYVLLNTADHHGEARAERVMATVFASWPAAMIFAPALGGLIADQWGIAADLWIGAVGFALALGIFALAADVRPIRTEAPAGFRAVLANQRFLLLALYYPLVLITLNIGYVLAPTYLEGVRQYSTGAIGFLFSLLSIGSLAFNMVVAKARPQISFIVLIAAVWAGTLLIWQSNNILLTGMAFILLGAISTMWLLAQSSFGQLVNPQQRGLALGITETLAYGAVALASWVAGQLYEHTPTHDLPLVAGIITIFVALLIWPLLSRAIGSKEINVQRVEKRTV
ncbi:MAG: MFS transporter [Anaerolineae bacterium]|nr:MFS transporter [Anaerolineae bacterium]